MIFTTSVKPFGTIGMSLCDFELPLAIMISNVNVAIPNFLVCFSLYNIICQYTGVGAKELSIFRNTIWTCSELWGFYIDVISSKFPIPASNCKINVNVKSNRGKSLLELWATNFLPD